MRKLLLIRWCALVACLVCAVSAGAYSFKSGNIYYTITSNDPATVEVANPDNDLNKYTGSVSIPASVTNNGTTYKVTGIGRSAFYMCHDLTNVSFPSTLTYIDTYAFYDCPYLVNVTLPKSLTSLGTYAFALCGSSSFTQIDIPDGVTSIGLGAFYMCSNLTRVTIGSGVKYIKEKAFYDCTALTNVTCKAMTPPSMESNAFDQSHYSSLPLKVPRSSVSTYQAHSIWGQFSNIQGLNYDFFVNDIYYRILNSSAKTVAVTYDTYGYYSGNVIIPQSVPQNNESYTVTEIDSRAFYNCSNLRAVVLPPTLQKINTNAFWHCTSLTGISIPDNVWYLASWAFQGCTSLSTVIIGTGVTSMGNYTFQGCTSLTNIRCKAYTPPDIMDATLSDQYSIATLTVPYMSQSDYRNAGYWSNFSTIEDADYDFFVDGLYYIRTGSNTASVSYSSKEYNTYSGDVVIPDQVTKDGVTYSVTGIRSYAFYNCPDLTSVELPQTSLQVIGSVAFMNCTSLAKIDIPNSVTLVEGGAFINCYNLRDVNIGENSTFVNQYNVFLNCDNLVHVTCFAKTPPPIHENVFPQSAYDNAWLLVPRESKEAYQAADNWKKFQHMDVTSSDFMVDGIYYKKLDANSVAVSCKDLTFNTYHVNTLNVPATVEYEGVTYNVTQVYDNAFAECSSLRTVNLPNSIIYIDYNAFRECGIRSIVVPDAVVGIGNSAFQQCHNLTRVTLGSGLHQLSGGLFYDTPNLERITSRATTPPSIMSDTFNENHYSDAVLVVPKSCRSAYQSAQYWSNFAHIAEIAYDFEKDGIYYNFTSNSTVEVTSEIDYYGSYSDSYEGSVDIPGFVTYGGRTYTVTAIGNNAFKMCKDLTEITMPVTIETIGSYAFHSCEGLTEVVIPFSVKTIKNNAFWLCMGLQEVVIPDGVTTIGSMAFRNCSSLGKVVIGKNVTSIGSTCFLYCPDINVVSCLAEVPPTLYDSSGYLTFDSDVYEYATLRVPYDSHDEYYSNARGWNQFNTVVSKRDVVPVTLGDVNGDNSVTIADVTTLIDLLLSGATINNPAADVTGDGQVTIGDVTTLIDRLLSGTDGGTVTDGPARREFLINTMSFNMIMVEGGTFMMGLEGDNLATPVHQVTLSDYHIGETEVTQGLWTLVMGNNPSNNANGDNLPVENMTWDVCQTFVNRISTMYDENFSLPTEAQWEFAARGGNKSQGYIYSGSNNVGEVAWYKSNSGNSTHVVGTKKANELGLYDMSGNVFEWCQDYWGAYTGEAQVNPVGPATGEWRVCRGSAYIRANDNNWLKCGGRTYDSPTMAAEDTGLRLSIQPTSN